MDNKLIKELKSDKLKIKSKGKAISVGDKKHLIEICNTLGRQYLQNQRYSEAIDEHKEELRYSLEIDCQLSEAVARRALGECYSENNEYKRALIEHKKYLRIAKSLDNQIEIQRALATIGRTHLLRAQELNTTDKDYEEVLEKSKNAFKEALDLCKKLNQLKEKELSEMRSRLYINLGLVFEMMGKYSESITNLRLSIELNKRHQLMEDLFRSQYNLASVYEKNNQLKLASDNFEEALKTAKKMNSKINCCDTLFAFGLVLMRLKEFQKSRKQFKKAFKLCSKLHSLVPEYHQKIERHLKIASVICDHFRQLSKAYNLEEKINLCDKLGDHFVEMRLFDVAVDFYKQQLIHSIQTDRSDSEIAKIYVSIAQTYADDSKFDEAIEYFEHELNCNRDNPIEETKSLMKIAEMKEYLRKEDLNHDIAQTYETALEKISTLDNNLLADILRRYLTFLEDSRLDSDKATEIEERLKVADTQRKTSIEIAEEEDETDIYEAYDLNDLSDCSTDSDEEEVRPKRMGKRLRINEVGETPLHKACIVGDIKQVEKLLAEKNPVNVRDHCGWTPLHEAAHSGHLEIVDLLLKNGADINDNRGKDTNGLTPLHDACLVGNLDVTRLLLKSGAKVSILNKFNETALEVLQKLKNKCIEDKSITEEELQEVEDIERQMQECLNKEGFDRKSVAILKSLNASNSNVKTHKSILRGNDFGSDDSDDSLEIPINKLRDNHKSCSNHKNKSDKSIDFDNPNVARKEYCSSISNLKRNIHSNKVSKVRPKSKPIPAILDENEVIDGDQWLIEDINDKKKRSCLDAYDAFNKRSKSYEPNQSERTRKSKPKPPRSRSESWEQLVSDESMSSDIEIQSFEPIEDKSEENNEINNKNNKSKVNTNSDKKPINMIVVFDDKDNTLLMIPIRNESSNFLWLKEESQKKYFENFGIKPIILLKTTDGALLSDGYYIFDVFDRHSAEHKVLAKIESWSLDSLDVRYKQICNSCGVFDHKDIVKDLQITQINGIFRLTTFNIPMDQMKPIFRALHRQNNLREFDISFSNVLFDASQEVFNCLEFLPSLQVLNLKGTGLTKPNMELLATKLCPNLVELNLGYNSVDDEFSEVIIKVIKHFPKLNIINLCGCQLTNRFIQSTQFKDCIKNSNLSSVILDYNTRVDSELWRQFRKL